MEPSPKEVMPVVDMNNNDFAKNPNLKLLDSSIHILEDLIEERKALLCSQIRQKIAKKSQARIKEYEECLSLMRDVFAWRDWFVQTETFKKLYQDQFIFCTIFSSDWGHHSPQITHQIKYITIPSCAIEIKPSGALTYYYDSPSKEGFSDLAIPEAAAAVFMLPFAKKLHQHITSGNVYRSISHQVTRYIKMGPIIFPDIINEKERPPMRRKPKQPTTPVRKTKQQWKIKVQSPRQFDPKRDNETIVNLSKAFDKDTEVEW